MIGDTAETDDSSSSSAEENDVLIYSTVSTTSAEYLGKSGWRWSDTPPPTSRTRGSNIFAVSDWGVQISPQNKVKCFDSYFSPAMLRHILRYTNQPAAAHYVRKKVQWDPIHMVELKAFFGILYLLGVNKSNHENSRNLWSDGPIARPVFKATMPVNRFEIIHCHLRFESMDTPCIIHEKSSRQVCTFREVWNFFESKSRENYKLSAGVCIDEQLIPFRDRCPFRQYLPSKPDKHGMKLFLLVDCNTGYVNTGQPFVGKAGNEITRGLATKVVKSLAKTLYHAGRNITADNYFTDFALASELLLKKTTYIGTLRKNKSDISPVLQANKTRRIGSTFFGCDNDTTLVSFVPKKSKSVLLVSTMHNDDKIDDQTGKPDITWHYNQTKGAADQMCHTYSVQRKIERWPLAYFINLLNIVGLNYYITYITRSPQWFQKLSHKRRQFLEDQGLDLMKPMMEKEQCLLLALLSQHNKPCLFVASHQQLLLITAKMSKVQQNLRKRNATDALLIESLLGSAQSAKKLFVPTILPRLKKSNADLHVSHRNSVFYQETCSSARNAKSFLCPV